MNYVSPEFKKSAFNCPFCGAFSNVSWAQLYYGKGYSTPIWKGICYHCKEAAYWADQSPVGVIVYPVGITTAPLPHPDMPEAIIEDYSEARAIANLSPKGASALLRLAIQKLCKELGQEGKKIDDDIRKLVEQGLPVKIQQAMDIVRVVGNNAVHPGSMDLNDTPEVVNSLFDLINLIVENQISEPKRIEEIYASLPNGAKAAIERRDATQN